MKLNLEKFSKFNPGKIESVIETIEDLGYKVEKVSDTQIQFEFKGHVVNLFPYSGWHTGESIENGRGILNLLNQIK